MTAPSRAGLPGFAHLDPLPCPCDPGDRWLCPCCDARKRARVKLVRALATFLRASRERALAVRSGMAEACEGMRVDETRWRAYEHDSMSFEPDGDPVDAFAYFDGSWSYDDPFGPTSDGGRTVNIRTAKIAVQRRHLADALSVCGSRGRA